MSNPYYSVAFNAIVDTLIRSASFNNEFPAIEAGFDAVATKVNASLKAPDGEVLANLPALALRASKSLAFDASGNPIATVAATSEEMAAAVAAAITASDAAIAAAASAATVAGATNALQLLQLELGII
jgi:1-aminocyclopropane-1-carboxylate deaminase/D-cysteine desulfhydrase-like pyridoxal-dependent ACC family enzyme